MKVFLRLCLFTPFFLSAQSSLPNPADTVIVRTSKTFFVGNTSVDVLIHHKKGDEIVYFNMHDNENTSVSSGLEVLRRYGGKLVELIHTGERNISFTLQGIPYTFDPNRMFTDVGAEKNLKAQSNNRYAPQALQAVRTFATEVVDFLQLDSAKVVVALHNNTDENYNIRDYLKGGTYENDVEATQYIRGTDADNFYYVTDSRFYNALSEAGQNVTLQRNGEATDDGSFSIYCGLKMIPYVNVEAEHGHYASQIVLMEVLREILVQGD